MPIRLSDEEVFNKLRYIMKSTGDETALRLLPAVSPEKRRAILEDMDRKIQEAAKKK